VAVRPFGQLLSLGPQNGLYKEKEHYGSGTPMLDMGDLFAFACGSHARPS